MKKTTLCLTALFVCGAMLLPTAAIDKLQPDIGGEDEELTFIEHDAVSGEETTFTLGDLDPQYSSGSVNSVSKYDSVNDGYYFEPTEPDWMKSDESMNGSSGESGEASPDKIISGSPWTRVTNVRENPYCKNTLILGCWESDEGMYYTIATGFMVGQKVMVTAGHVFWDPEAKTGPHEIRIFTKFDKNMTNYTQLLNETDYYHPQRWVLSSNFQTTKGDSDQEYDWCYVTLFTAIGKSTGTYGMSSYSVPKDKEIIISGYPGDHVNYPSEMFHQYKSSGVMNKLTDYTVKHTCSTREGLSGAALSSVNYVAWGIHTGSMTNKNLNVGVRFAPYLYELISNKVSSTNE